MISKDDLDLGRLLDGKARLFSNAGTSGGDACEGERIR
jgi:hypothetical protein